MLDDPNKLSLVTVTIENRGDAGAEVPVPIQTATGERTVRVLAPAHQKVSASSQLPGAPTKVVANDGSVPVHNSKDSTYDVPARPQNNACARLPSRRPGGYKCQLRLQQRDLRPCEDRLSYIQFLGAAGVVTGSKHLINTGDASGKGGIQVLVDCGLFQGQKEWRERNWQDLPIPARDIDAVILTHAHLDHSGWIPRLVKQGFHGPIYATPPTIDLCGILLPDSGHLQEEDAAFHNRYKTSKHVPALPLYTMEEAQQCLTLFQAGGF